MTSPLSTVQVCERAGVTFRQLDYWHRAGLFPDVPTGSGSGSCRLWAPRHVAVAALWRALHHLGATSDSCCELADWISELAGPWQGLLVVQPGERTAGRLQRAPQVMAELHHVGLHQVPGGGCWVIDLAWCWQHANRLIAVA